MAPSLTKWGAFVPLLLVNIVLLNHPGYASAGCPWNAKGLLKWSDSGTWKRGRIPRDNDEVLIESGKRVLLDTQPATLNNVTIAPGAVLVWGDVADLELNVEYLMVQGEFHIGASDCRFNKNAFIKLRGRYDSKYEVYNNRKFIAVAEGATIEIHGRKKTPWTRLAQTIKPLSDLPCAFLYDHSDREANPFAAERRDGMHVIVWREDGTLFDYNVFSPPYAADFGKFVASIPNGKVIGMFAFNSLGERSTDNFKALDNVIVNDLGGQMISKVRSKLDTYSLITRKGSKSSTVEHYKTDGQKEPEGEAFIRITDWNKGVDFQVAKSAATRDQYFRVMSTEAAYPKLELADDVIGWGDGDKIVIASTDFDWEQAEVREIINCRDCSRSQIRVNQAFENPHFGNITYNVDERAEVGLLSRNILIQGVMEDPCYAADGRSRMLCRRFGRDTFGGHVKILRGHKAAHIQGVELYHMGQQYIEGSYPLHFHMCQEVKGSWFRENSIHHSFSRCVTVHGTDNAEVTRNVCYDHLGHGYFLEDSVEQDNVFDGNLGLGSRFGTLLMSDSTREWCKEDYPKKDFSVNCEELATFWLTHPNNEIMNNAAAGGEGHGYMYVFANLPLTKSYKVQQYLGKVQNFSQRHYPIKSFYNNVAHSYKQSGVFMDSLISTGKLADEDGVPENGIIQTESLYDPRDPPGDPNGVRVWTKMERVTAYRNFQENLWIKGGNVNVTFSSVADGPEGFSGGTTGTDTGTSMEYSLFIGRTDNRGKASTYAQRVDTKSGEVVLKHEFDRSYPGNPWKTYTGVSIYQGPVYVKHSYFDQFYVDYWNDSWTEVLGERPVTYGAAVSFKKDSTYPTMTSQYTTNLTFGFCDSEKKHWLFFGNSSLYDWEDLDGTKAAFNVDKDGSLTGTPGVYIIRNHRFFTGPECTYHADWNMALCPYRYIKMEILGKDGNLGNDLKDKYPLIVRRDDVPRHPFDLMGEVRREWAMRTHSSYLVDFNNTVEGAMFPSEIKVYAYGVESQDVVRVGICLPLDTTDIDIRSDYPTVIRNYNHTTVNSLADLDADKNKNAFFHDKKNGILFFKIWSHHDRTNDSQQCSEGNCYAVKIYLNNGNLKKMRTCSEIRYPAFEDKRKTPRIPPIRRCPGGTGSPEGLGAIRWNEIKKIVHQEYDVPCITNLNFLGRKKVNDLGCFVEDTQQFVLPQDFLNAMTRDWCALRCYQKGYRYAGLTVGKTCQCGQSVTMTAEAKDLKGRGCDKACTGNDKQLCGSFNRINVLTTGLA
ncbi:cell surface hyaluronidase-like [Littorina saxatilis]|uniref:G8 domain-containing protein n=1 Tax=Littorina saxatilis TaxID=31220 RepID=A0AAN9B6H5_9CAEN